MNVLCLFVNYNNSDYSINCVDSLVENKSLINLTIMIIDNNSIEKEKIKLLKWQAVNSSVNVVYLEKNIGYFPALNYGLNQYKKNEYDYVVIGNNDLLFQSNFLSILEQKQYNKDIFVISPNIINKDNNHQNPAVREKYTRLQLFYLEIYHLHYFFALLINIISSAIKFRGSQKSKNGWDKSGYISIGYGACYILTRNYLSKIKEIPSYLFLMNEENALSDIVFRNGGRIYYDKNLVVNHMEHSSILKIPKRKKYYIEQESYRISKKHFNNAELYDHKII